MCCATMRAMMSVCPPAAKGTTKRMVGKAWARKVAGNARPGAAANNRRRDIAAINDPPRESCRQHLPLTDRSVNRILCLAAAPVRASLGLDRPTGRSVILRRNAWPRPSRRATTRARRQAGRHPPATFHRYRRRFPGRHQGRRAPGRTVAPLRLPRGHLPGEPARHRGAGPAGLPVRCRPARSARSRHHRRGREGAAEALKACAAKGTRAAVVFSSGFAELGAAGEAAQKRLGEIARRTGMRVLGPNCLGAVSVAERSIATFSIVLEDSLPPAGPLGIASQSGNLGSYTMLLARERGIGVSRFITTGNECDIDIADALAWLARDAATKVVLCVLETCRDAPRLVAALEASQARRQAGGRTEDRRDRGRPGGRGIAHRRAGRVGCGVRRGLPSYRSGAGAERGSAARPGPCRGGTSERLPRSRRTMLLTASGGFGVLLADAASAAGLELPTPKEATQRRISRWCPLPRRGTRLTPPRRCRAGRRS